MPTTTQIPTVVQGKPVPGNSRRCCLLLVCKSKAILKSFFLTCVLSCASEWRSPSFFPSSFSVLQKVRVSRMSARVLSSSAHSCTFQGCVKPSPFFSTTYGTSTWAILKGTDLRMCRSLSILL